MILLRVFKDLHQNTISVDNENFKIFCCVVKLLNSSDDCVEYMEQVRIMGRRIELHPGAKNQTRRIKNCHGAVNTHSIANGFGGFSCEPYALDGGSQDSTHNFPGLTSWWHWSVGLLTGMLDYRTETNQLRSNVY
jgi:hypothetical protein